MVSPFEELCIDSIEQQLDEEEEKHLMESISEDTEKQRIFKLYQSSKLVPDMDIRYTGKLKLKKHTFKKPGLRILFPAAAAAILLIAFLVFNQDGIIPVPQEISSIETQDKSPVMENPDKSPVMETQSGQEIINIAEVNTQTDDQVQHDEAPVQLMKNEHREQIQLSRIQPILITKILTVSSITSYAQMQKLRVDPDPVQQLALNQVASKFLVARNLPERARNTFWKLADAGVRGLNSFIEEEIALSRKVDYDGRTTEFKFETSVFGISTPLQNTGMLQ